MGLLNRLGIVNNPHTVQISNGQYSDISSSGLLGVNHMSLNVKLNNGVIAGIPGNGRAQLIDSLLYDATISGNPVVYVYNHINSRPLGRYGSEVESGILGGQALIIDINKRTEGMNLFKGMTLDTLVDFMIDIMSNYISLDESMRDFCQIWYHKIFEVLKMTLPKEKFCINKMDQYTDKWLKAKYDELYKSRKLNQKQYNTIIDELNIICATYQSQLIKFSNFSKIINTNGLSKLLSGTINMNDIYKQRMVLLINLYESVNTKESTIFLKLLLRRLIIEETKNPVGAVCMFEDCNIKEIAPLFLDLLKIGQLKEHSGSIYFTERNITWWRENLSQLNEHPASYCNAFFVFRQNIEDDLKFWSALSGSTKKTEVSHNSAPLGTVHPLEASSWKNIILNCCPVYTGSSSTQIDAYQVEAQEIDALDDQSSIVIIRMNDTIYNRRVRWV